MNKDQLQQLAREAREGIKKMTSVGNAKCEYGECYIPSDEAIDSIIRSALEKAVKFEADEHNKTHATLRIVARERDDSAASVRKLRGKLLEAQQPKAEPWTTTDVLRIWTGDRVPKNDHEGMQRIADAHNASIGAPKEPENTPYGVKQHEASNYSAPTNPLGSGNANGRTNSGDFGAPTEENK